jgi:hypothetical protein
MFLEEEQTRAVIEAMSKRHPGAFDVSFRLIDYLKELAILDIDILLQREIVGIELYLLFESCNRDIAALHASLMQGTDIAQLQLCRESKFYQKEERVK